MGGLTYEIPNRPYYFSHFSFKCQLRGSIRRQKLQHAVGDFKRQRTYTKNWVPADLRHSFAVNFLTDGGSLKDLQYILGHNNVFDTKRLHGEVAGKQNIHID